LPALPGLSLACAAAKSNTAVAPGVATAARSAASACAAALPPSSSVARANRRAADPSASVAAISPRASSIPVRRASSINCAVGRGRKRTFCVRDRMVGSRRSGALVHKTR
jgi:hypothetical protein